jgi:hypothetical protein
VRVQGSRLPRITLAIAAVVAIAAAHASSAGAVTPAACGKLLSPTSGIYFGAAPAFSGGSHQLEGEVVTPERIAQFDQDAGRSAIWSEFDQHTFVSWAFPRDKVLTAWRAGKIPYVRLFAHAGSDVGNGNPPEQYPGEYSLQNFIDGRFDAQLKAWADAARDTDIPILMEYGTEESAYWGPWAGIYNGAGATTGYGDPTLPDGPERFRDAYRHIVTLFRAEGATNVTWFFHPSWWFAPNYPWESLHNYYPGNDVVDWIGLSTYGLPVHPDKTYISFDEALGAFHAPSYPGLYADVASLGPKPIALVEVGITEVPQKARWIRDMLPVLQSGRYPRIQGFAWWNSFDVNTAIESSPAAQQAFHDVAQSPLFNAKPQLSGNCLPARPRVKVVRNRVTWRALPNATSYEVWRNGRRVATTTRTSYRGARGHYRVRGVNPLGPGPFG